MADRGGPLGLGLDVSPAWQPVLADAIGGLVLAAAERQSRIEAAIRPATAPRHTAPAPAGRGSAVRTAIGADHRSFALQRKPVDRPREAGHEVVDLGTRSDRPADYPAIAEAVARSVSAGIGRARPHRLRQRRGRVDRGDRAARRPQSGPWQQPRIGRNDR